jgi:hypothetical protein
VSYFERKVKSVQQSSSCFLSIGRNHSTNEATYYSRATHFARITIVKTILSDEVEQEIAKIPLSNDII